MAIQLHYKQECNIYKSHSPTPQKSAFGGGCARPGLGFHLLARKVHQTRLSEGLRPAMSWLPPSVLQSTVTKNRLSERPALSKYVLASIF